MVELARALPQQLGPVHHHLLLDLLRKALHHLVSSKLFLVFICIS
jgi:hypothetical protein